MDLFANKITVMSISHLFRSDDGDAGVGGRVKLVLERERERIRSASTTDGSHN